MYYNKYLKYKTKYIQLLNNQYNLNGGGRENKTYIDFITKDSNETIKIDLDNYNEINKMLNNYFNNITELLCLDFHGVTDLYNDDEKIPSKLPKCVISYISGNPKTITNTINTMRPRLLTDEIILGIIVYNKNETPTCGTKGWILSKIIESNNKIKIHFIDDSKKNINCVNNINSKNIITYFINKYKNPKEYLTKILNKI